MSPARRLAEGLASLRQHACALLSLAVAAAAGLAVRIGSAEPAAASAATTKPKPKAKAKAGTATTPEGRRASLRDARCKEPPRNCDGSKACSHFVGLLQEPGDGLAAAVALLPKLNACDFVVGSDGARIPLLVLALAVFQHVRREFHLLKILLGLLEAGADPNADSDPPGFGGGPLLWNAIQMGHADLAVALMQRGASVAPALQSATGPGSGVAPLHLLVMLAGQGTVDLIKHLMRLDSAIGTGDLRSARELVHAPQSGRDLKVDGASCFASSAKCREAIEALDGEAHTWRHADALAMRMEAMRAMLAELRRSDGFDVRSGGLTTGRHAKNVYHMAAVHGAADAVTAFVDVALETRDASVARAVLDALAAQDTLGRTPWHYAALRFGRDGSVWGSLVDAVQRLSPRGARTPAAFVAALPADAHGKTPDDYAGLFAASESSAQRGRGAAPSSPPSSGTNGGWLDATSTTIQAAAAANGVGCDIAVLQRSELAAERGELADLVEAGRPVLIRGGALADRKMRDGLARTRFLSRHGHRRVAVSTVPYAESFGLERVSMSLAEYARRVVDRPSSSAEPPLYAFTGELVDERPGEFADDFELHPPLLAAMRVGGLGVTVDTRQFYLGPAGSGAPWHYHKLAYNAMPFGRKLWFLRPPASALYSKQPIAAWLARHGWSRPGDALPGVAQCVQEAGDVLLVPKGWAHATLNLRPSIGVAYELDVPGGGLDVEIHASFGENRL